MSQTGTTPAFDYELLFTYVKNQQASTLPVGALALCVCLMVMVWTPPVAAVFWLTVVLASQGALIRSCRRFMDEPAEEMDLNGWRRWFLITECISATAWGSIVLLPADESVMMAAALIKVGVLLTVMAVRTALSATVSHALYPATLPIALFMVISFHDHPVFEVVAVGAVAIFAQIFFVVLARRIQENALAIHNAQAENEMLISHLEEEKSKSDDARIRAEDANLAKSKFLATMSHELRTPLNAVLGFSEILETEAFGPHEVPQYGEYASHIHRSGTHLLKLINEILDLSRIEAGRYELRVGPVMLADVVEDCCYMMKMRAGEKAISVRQEFAEDMRPIMADEQAIRQICLNLLSNAVKYTLSHGEVEVLCGWTRSGGQYIAVRDNGPGIPDDEIDTVLDAFGRGSMAHKNADEGAGLGLTIVQNLISLHEGSFSIQSKLRVGTEVIAKFPASRVIETLPKQNVEASLSDVARKRAA